MKIAFFDTHKFEKPFFLQANERHKHAITFFETRLSQQTAILAKDFECACCFVNDTLDAKTLCLLKCENFRLIALRSAGFNNVDLKEAMKLGLTVVRVPSYSPHAVAELAVGLILTVNRKIHKSYARVRDLNFSLDGLVGFDLFGKTIGVIGTGKIGSIFCKIMHGFGCRVLAFDQIQNSDLIDSRTVEYVSLDALYKESDILSLHVPLTEKTRHMIDGQAMDQMKHGAMLINTSRGALIDTAALVQSLKNGRISAAALDVYEEEENIFFRDLSSEILMDDVLARLITFPNVLITSHQGFLTREALKNIADTTLQNVTDFENGNSQSNQIPF